MKNIVFIFYLIIILLYIPSVCYARGSGDGGIFGSVIGIFFLFLFLSNKRIAKIYFFIIISLLIMFILMKQFTN